MQYAFTLNFLSVYFLYSLRNVVFNLMNRRSLPDPYPMIHRGAGLLTWLGKRPLSVESGTAGHDALSVTNSTFYILFGLYGTFLVLSEREKLHLL